MNHILSKITINLSLKTEFSLDGEVGRSTTNPVSDMVLGGTHICDHFNLTTGLFLGDFKDSNDSPSVVSDMTMLPCSYTPATTRDETATATYEVTIIPQTLSANTFKVNFQLDGKTYSWTYPSEITFLSGKRYVLNLSVGKYALDITGADFGDGGGAEIVEL